MSSLHGLSNHVSLDINILLMLPFAIAAEVSKAEGRLAQTTNVVMGVTAAEGSGREEWRVLDEKVFTPVCVNC